MISRLASLAMLPAYSEPDDWRTAPITQPKPPAETWWGNFGRGVEESAVRSAGNALDATGVGLNTASVGLENVGDFLNWLFPASVPSGGRIGYRPDGTPAQPAVPLENKAIDIDLNPSQSIRWVARRAKHADFGFNPETTWADVKADPLHRVLPFITEQAVMSLPGMDETKKRRAKNNRSDAPAGAGSSGEW
jgi:hypothetical protein